MFSSLDLSGGNAVTMHWALWGKADRTVGSWHPLLCHLIDVAEVAGRLLDVGLASRLRKRLLEATGLEDGAARSWILFLVALHDLGKASPAFQAKNESRRDALRELGFDFSLERGDSHHGVLSIRLLETLLEGRYGFRRSKEIARAVGMHHGQAPTDLDVSRVSPRQLGRAPPWSVARAELISELEALYGIDGARPDPAIARDGGFLLLLAGLTSVADWLGSMVEFFRYAPETRDATHYRSEAAARAAEAVAAAGFRCLLPSAATTFQEVFGNPPRPLHETVEALLPQVEPGSLVIVEAPTGEGKTEAALQLAEHFSRAGQEGLFVALPTQATSNQTYRRVRAHLERSRPAQRTNLQLVHGAAASSNEHRRLRAAAVFDSEEGGAVVAESWFTGGKRALLAATAVGTIDQALLGVLRLRHCFVRLFGLAGKTVILDEIHAYDTYTSRLVDRLLGWLHDLGASVVLLSATLPARRRAELAATFGGAAAAERQPFPRITVVSDGNTRVVPTVAHAPPRTIAIERLGDDFEWVARQLAADLEEGGCAAWICNTVGRAQEAYRTLKRLQSQGVLPADTELGLIHSRLPQAVRAWRERQARRRFGPEGRRPNRAILVGTQVLEQSLDLDFDRMATDFAPVDLLLQRAGRLHRHHRERRPAPLCVPRLLLVEPEGAERPEGPSFTAVAGIYEPAILLRSWWSLRQRDSIVLPDQLEPLIEQVYGEGPLDGAPFELVQRLGRAVEEFERRQECAEDAAEARLLPAAGAPGVLGTCSSPLEEDAPELHPSLQALTRLGGPSVQVVCLYETPTGTALDPVGRRPVDLRRPADPTLTRALLCRTMNISSPHLATALLQLSEPHALRTSSALRRHRALRFRTDGSSVELPGLRLDRELGLVFEKGKEVDS